MRLIPQTMVGIEVAGDDARIAVVRAVFNKPKVVRADLLAGFGRLSEEDKLTTLVAHFKRYKLSGFSVHLTLPGTSGITRDLEFPASIGTADALRSAVALQVENLSPWSADEIYWDCTWELPAKGARTTIVHVGLVPRAVLDPWIALFRSARLALAGASLSSLSWAHGVSVLWGPAQPSMVMAAEKEYVEGALIRDGRIFGTQTRGVPSAPAVAAAASQLMRSARVDSIEQLRLLGHGSETAAAGLESPQLPIQGAGTAGNIFGAVSTALLGVVRSGFRLNLIPQALRYQRNAIQFVPTYILALLLVLLGLGAWLREPYQQSLYAQQLDQEASRLAPQVRSVADQETRLNQISERVKALDGLIRGRDANLEALRELSRVLPNGTFLTSYIYQDNAVTIAGFSDSAASIQKVIEDSPVFRDAQFVTSITRDPSGKDRFSLKAMIEARQ